MDYYFLEEDGSRFKVIYYSVMYIRRALHNSCCPHSLSTSVYCYTTMSLSVLGNFTVQAIFLCGNKAWLWERGSIIFDQEILGKIGHRRDSVQRRFRFGKWCFYGDKHCCLEKVWIECLSTLIFSSRCIWKWFCPILNWPKGVFWYYEIFNEFIFIQFYISLFLRKANWQNMKLRWGEGKNFLV